MCGSTGAGKTTFATNLGKQVGAPVFSVDDWMVSLFSKDMPASLDWPWISERAARCEARILDTAFKIASVGMPSILDIGLLRYDRRAEVASIIAAQGYTSKLHFLDTPSEERWRRIEHRNSTKGETFHMDVSRFMFDFIEGLWEPPSMSELKELNGTRVI